MKQHSNRFLSGLVPRFVPRFAALFVAAALSGCGGGGSSPDPGSSAPTDAEGVYGGTLTGGVWPEFQLLVLPDGQFWSLYGQTVGGTFLVAGFIQGTGETSGAGFASSNARDFGALPATAGSVSAAFNASAKTISGTVSAAAGSVSFNGGPMAGSLYNYRSTADLRAIAGTWIGEDTGGETVTLSVSTSGNVVANTSGGCNASGTFTPRADGRNVFSVSLLQGVGCAFEGQTIRGVVLIYPLASGRTQLVGAVVDDARTAGTAVFASR